MKNLIDYRYDENLERWVVFKVDSGNILEVHSNEATAKKAVEYLENKYYTNLFSY